MYKVETGKIGHLSVTGCNRYSGKEMRKNKDEKFRFKKKLK